MRIRVGVLGLVGLLGGRHRTLLAQNIPATDPGRAAFESRCARCHGGDGNGGEMGPPIAQRLPPLDDQQLTKADSATASRSRACRPTVISDRRAWRRS